MSNERCLLWISALALMSAGILLGQAPAIALAAAVGLYLVYAGSIAGDGRAIL